MADNNRVVLDYTNRDYLSLRAALVGLAKGYMPDWETVGEPGDFGTLLLELFAYTGDVMNYYIDRMVSEAFLTTAVRRQSVLFIADMLGYQPLGKNPSTVSLTFEWKWDGGQTQGYDTTYIVSAASVEGDTVTLMFPENTNATFDVLQTIVVDGLGDEYDGVFNIDEIILPEDNQDNRLKLTYRFNGEGQGVIDAASSAVVRTGMVVRIPKGTVLTAGSNDSEVKFELLFDVVLDRALGQPTVEADPTGEYSLTAYGSAIEGTSVVPTQIGTSKGVPGAEFVIPKAGVFDGSVEVFTREGQQVVEWTRLDKVTFAGPRQNVFTTFVDDNDFTHILFGDNIAGRIPPADAEILAAFRYGAGAAANSLGTRSVASFDNEEATAAGITVFNPRPPSGGTDVETVESMRYSIPRSETVQERGVNLKDFEYLALRVPGVAKAVAYGDTYSTVFVRIASSSESRPYTTTNITHAKYGTTYSTLVTDTYVEVGTNQLVYLNGTPLSDGYDNGIPISVVNSVPESRTVSLQSVRVYSPGEMTMEFTTATSHGFRVGDPVRVTGVNARLTSQGLDGVYEVTHVDSITDEDGVPQLRKFKVHLPAVYTPGGQFTDAVGQNALFTTDLPGVSQRLPFLTVGSADLVEEVTDLAPVTEATVMHTDVGMTRLMTDVEEYMEYRKLVGTTVYAEPVQWDDINIRVEIQVADRYSRTAVRAAVDKNIRSLMSFDNVEFGKDITKGDVYRTVLNTEGVAYVIGQIALWNDRNVDGTYNPQPDSSDTSTSVVVDPHWLPRLTPGKNEIEGDNQMVVAFGGLVNT